MNGTQQASEPLAQQPLQPAAANVNASASANANGNSTVAKKRKKEGLKPIITTETLHLPVVCARLLHELDPTAYRGLTRPDLT
ncbi:hypothetical protein CGGC5_v011204 [Colletotrichum fructicola Nara gc5]|uniref:Uncharacterized protein n=2 Tax=Colletotrichum fructicola (strain Nara gc5) TaxID=1213859 RepID=A0A7J6IVW9_COLFN|nr:hypothetical protein CGGC5_v011204 [Colletotrichum fructicola Nara gc5]KAF5488229.1 hypothetical protein CGCF413_v012734 [Colletotrichum fructicola]